MSDPHRVDLRQQVVPPVPAMGQGEDAPAIKPGSHDKIYPTVKIATILESLAKEGVSADDALADLNISRSAIYSPETRVSLNQVIECCRNADRLTQDPQFAFRTGLRFRVSAYGIYGFAMLCSTDFRQTMQFAVKYHQLATPLVDVAFEERENDGIWTISPLPHPRIDARLYKFLVELQFGIYVSVRRDVMDPSFGARELRVTYDKPGDALDYPGLYGCPVLFNQPKNEFRFDAAWLDRKPALGNAITHAAMVKLCDSLLDELRHHIGLVGEVRKLLLVNLMRPTDFNAVARHLNMSPRTLRRKLREENTSFRDLVGDLRMEMAMKYLRDTSLTVEEISYTVGFSEASGFRRAFHRWAGAPPEQYRRAAGKTKT